MESILINCFRVAVAALLLTFGSHQALAVCVAGVGDSCPISKAEAETLLRPRVDNKVVGQFLLPLKLFAIAMPKLPADATPAIKATWNDRYKALQDTYTFILSPEDCAQLPGKFPAIATDHWIAACRLGRRVLGAGLAELELGLTPGVGGDEARLVFKFTDEGKAQVAKFKLNNSSDPQSGANALAGASELRLATGKSKFVRIIRTTGLRSPAGQSVSLVEFEYAVEPNTWGLVEMMSQTVLVDMTRGVGTATFSQSPTGWRLEEIPNF